MTFHEKVSLVTVLFRSPASGYFYSSAFGYWHYFVMGTQVVRLRPHDRPILQHIHPEPFFLNSTSRLRPFTHTSNSQPNDGFPIDPKRCDSNRPPHNNGSNKTIFHPDRNFRHPPSYSVTPFGVSHSTIVRPKAPQKQ